MALRIFEGKGSLPSNTERYRYVNDPYGTPVYIQADDYMELENQIECPKTGHPLQIVLHGRITEGMSVEDRFKHKQKVEKEFEEKESLDHLRKSEYNYKYKGAEVSAATYKALQKDPFHTTTAEYQKKMETTYNEKPHIYQAHEKVRAQMRKK